MRCMIRNKTEFYYAITTGKAKDEYGNQVSVYSNPIKKRGNVSAPLGEVSERAFGIDILYDRKIVFVGKCDMDEETQFWIDTMPELNEDGTTDTPCDYYVARIGKSLNSVRVWLKKVNIDGA